MLADVRAEILAELTAEIPPEIAVDEITVSMLAKSAGCDDNPAKRLLDRKVAEHLMTKRQVRSEGRVMTAYRKVGP